MPKKFYYIDGEGQIFPRLSDVKAHVWSGYTPRERVKYLTHATIVGVLGKGVYSTTPIDIYQGGNRWSFGRTRKEVVSVC